MRNFPSLKQLAYLTALAEERHFGRAAERCFVTQSTMSAAIRELEEIFGTKLFERTKRSVMLTPLGRKISQAACEILLKAEDMLDLAGSERQPLTGEIHIGAIRTIGPYVLPKAMLEMRRAYPELRPYLLEEKTDELLQRLRKGDLDCALIALPFDIAGLESRSLGFDRFSIALPANHALAKRKSVKVTDVDPSALILLTEGHCLKTHALSACRLAEGELHQSFQATSLGTLVQMVDAGLGVTLLPELAIRAGILSGTTIQTLPIKGGDEAREIALVWRQTSPRGRDYDLLADCLRQAIKF